MFQENLCSVCTLRDYTEAHQACYHHYEEFLQLRT